MLTIGVPISTSSKQNFKFTPYFPVIFPYACRMCAHSSCIYHLSISIPEIAQDASRELSLLLVLLHILVCFLPALVNWQRKIGKIAPSRSRLMLRVWHFLTLASIIYGYCISVPLVPSFYKIIKYHLYNI